MIRQIEFNHRLGVSSFLVLKALYLLFFLIKKVNKKIKANLPHVRDSAEFAIATHKLHKYRLQSSQI